MTNKDAIEAMLNDLKPLEYVFENSIVPVDCFVDLSTEARFVKKHWRTIKEIAENQITVEWLEGQKVDHGAEGSLAPYEIGIMEGCNLTIDKMISKVKGE